MTRQATLSAIRAQSDVPVLVIGGGINGVGVFRDLALQGVDVLLVEMNDFISGGSAASSHMVHGGLRYLENGEFRLVREALAERNRLLQNAPHYVKPLPTTIPIFNYSSGLLNAPLKFLGLLDAPSQRGALVIKAGLTMYDLFTARQQTLPRHRLHSRESSLARRPALNPDIVHTAQYYDAWMPYPERIGLELVLDAEADHPGARALNYVRVVGATAQAVELEDRLTGERVTVRPEVVVNAAGPWIDHANDALNRGSHFIGGTKGSHIVVDHPALLAACAGDELFFENSDGRITLILPFMDRVLIGTTDIPIDDPDDAHCTEAEVDYMLEAVRVVFPDIRVGREHIVFRYSGVRPLPASTAATPGQISRDHSIRTIEAGVRGDYPILSLVGGKWTTFRAFAEKVTDDVLHRLDVARRGHTAQIPIGGGADYPVRGRDGWLAKYQVETGYSRQRLETLLERYGTRALEVVAFCGMEDDAPLDSLPDYTRREIMFIAAHEKVVRLEDILLRRTALAMRGVLSRAGVAELATWTGAALGWSEDVIAEQTANALDVLASLYGVQMD
ncbi:MAG: glycerol-3-phosphate dehydrogenase/oxidase [Anaerolineaceae bacterium]|nr:MAG: glycerol-3-phosphate dehydrogenase/oxidase [Anaerolineaceae bacterium]